MELNLLLLKRRNARRGETNPTERKSGSSRRARVRVHAFLIAESDLHKISWRRDAN